MSGIYKEISSAVKGGRRAVLVTSFQGASPQKSVAVEGTEGWSALEDSLPVFGYHVKEPPIKVAGDGDDKKILEFFCPKPRAVIFGGGHIALPLVTYASMLDFTVTVFDDRPAYANAARFPEADEVICDSFDNVLEDVKLTENDYVIIVTRGHQHDTECLKGVLKNAVRPAYIGMIGSKRRVGFVFERLGREGFTEEEISLVHSPIGLKIGAVTPAEIALSIFAEIVQHRRQGDSGKGYESSDMELVDWLAQNSGEAQAIVTILATKGSTPREAGARMVLRYDGFTKGSIGGGCAESDVITKARQLIREGGSEIMTVDLTEDVDEEGMVCGGTMDVLIEAVASIA